MSRLLIVSNRLPVNVTKRSDGLSFRPSVGGLATGISSVFKSRQGQWIGWPGVAAGKISEDEKQQIANKLGGQNCHCVFLSARDVKNYYHGFCNKTVWPLFHYFPFYTMYEDSFWQAYMRVNQAFCDSVVKIAQPGDYIWVHDYQLMLLPELIRARIGDAQIGFFLHIPFPSFELFRLLPWRKEILTGILGADLVGFHTYDYVRHFLSSAARITGFEHSLGTVTADNRIVKVDAFPMGIDHDKYACSIDTPQVKQRLKTIRREVGDRKIIISIDRLDYTKGIVRRLEAFDLFLTQNPQYKENVTMILVAVPSRTGVERYMELRKRLEWLVGRINGEHGTMGWVPVWYLYRFLPFERLAALYNAADVALVTPLRDGMNLIAKEFIATKRDGRGVLILSEMAGATSELGEAVIVNPQNKAAIVKAIKQALEMPEDEQIERNRLMQSRISHYTVARWAGDFLETLSAVREAQQKLFVRKLGPPAREKLIDGYKNSESRLLMLDYDGTLVGFAPQPEKAEPDEKLLTQLKSLAADAKNEVVIISGRDKATLNRWLGGLKVCLVAEHGAWIRQKNQQWQTIETLRNDWKDTIKPIMQLYTDRTPGSFIEEKDFSLVWHFRRSDTELAYVRGQELKNAVVDLTANLGVGVFEGSKILEVKNIAVGKGQAAEQWLKKRQWDFILAAGDDYTDEELFEVLTEDAYSIKIGQGISKARFNLDSVYDLRLLIEQLAEKTRDQRQ